MRPMRDQIDSGPPFRTTYIPNGAAKPNHNPNTNPTLTLTITLILTLLTLPLYLRNGGPTPSNQTPVTYKTPVANKQHHKNR